MSGGHFDYMYHNLDIYHNEMEDKELNKLLIDFQKLLYELEWYKSGDTSKDDYKKYVKKFKGKWLKEKK
jgi:DNA polymerase sigma